MWFESVIVFALFGIFMLLSFIFGAKTAQNEKILSKKQKMLEIIDPTEEEGIPEDQLFDEEGKIKEKYINNREDDLWQRQEANLR